MKSIIIWSALLLQLSSAFSQTTDFTNKFPLIDRYIDSVMREWKVPGLALGIVYKDHLIYGKGYGFRNLQKNLPVEITTLFPIASNTKLFTATGACILVAEGKLSLDKPVRNYMPSLNFNNDELNTKVTLRDMLSHRTGLSRYDGIRASSPIPNEVIAKVSFMKPQMGIREGYIYNNMMFIAVGGVMENVSGKSWEEIIREKIFQPLAMRKSCFSDQDMVESNDYSLGYFMQDSTTKLLPVTHTTSERLGPAGSIKSNIEEMSHWMIAQLNGGKYEGLQVIPENVIRETLIPNTIADKDGKWDELSNSLYGLGRSIQTYKGYKITSHTGATNGYYSNLTFIPGQQLGIFIVYNGKPGGNFRSGIVFPVIDYLLGLTYTPWSQRYKKEFDASNAQEKKVKDSIAATQVKNTTPSHILSAYTGTYSSPIYGSVSIEIKNGQLFFLFRKQRSVLYHFHYDQYITREENDLDNFRLNFLTNGKGEIERINMSVENDPVTDFVKQNKSN